MKKKILASLMAIAIFVVSFSMSVFAATEELDITPDTLREVNGAAEGNEKENEKGDTWAFTGPWHEDTGNTWLEPFSLWPHPGTEATVVFMNYGNFIKIANNIDLSKYAKATITLTSAATLEGGYELGFFSKAIPFGQQDAKNTTDGYIVSGEVPTGEAGWAIPRTCEIDLTNVNYKGDLFLSYYMAGTDGCCVTGIEFTLKDGETPVDPTPSDPTDSPDPEKPPKTGDMDIIVILAAAGMVLTVLFKKKITE